MNAFLKDLKHSARMFLQAPGFTLVVIGALALGIGANTAIFSLVNTVLLKRGSFPDQDRLVIFENVFKTGKGAGDSPNEYNFQRQQTASFQDVSAYAFNVANLTGDSAPEQIQTTRASANFFPSARRGRYPRPHLHRRGRFAQSPQNRRARLRFLAAPLRRRPQRHREAHDAQRRRLRNYRRRWAESQD